MAKAKTVTFNRNDPEETEVVVRHPYAGPYHKVTSKPKGEALTKQSFKESCDINNIMRRYVKTGVIDHVNKWEPQYGDVTGADFQKAVSVITQSEEMFQDLPAKVRDVFENDVGAFLDFVADGKSPQALIDDVTDRRTVEIRDPGSIPSPEEIVDSKASERSSSVSEGNASE